METHYISCEVRTVSVYNVHWFKPSKGYILCVQSYLKHNSEPMFRADTVSTRGLNNTCAIRPWPVPNQYTCVHIALFYILLTDEIVWEKMASGFFLYIYSWTEVNSMMRILIYDHRTTWGHHIEPKNAHNTRSELRESCQSAGRCIRRNLRYFYTCRRQKRVHFFFSSDWPRHVTDAPHQTSEIRFET
jgi:hypothetical protein